MRRIIPILVVLLAARAYGADAPVPQPAPAPGTAPAAAAPTPAAAPATAPAAPARDPESERAGELSRSILVGKAVELAVGDRKVLGIYTEQMAATPKGAVLLLHDLGGHADWPGLIAHLRRDLPARGWDTLSLQLPIPAQRTTTEQQLAFLDGAGVRIDAALAHLKAANQTDVVVVGHGFGAIAALEYALKNPQAFRGLVVAGLPHYRQGEPRLDAAGLLSQLKLPVLDLFGDGDRWEVVATAAERRQAARKNPGYSQLTLPRADHFFSGQEPFMARRVHGWLERHPASRQTAPESDAPAPSAAPAAAP